MDDADEKTEDRQDKKPSVIHARVSPALEQEIRERAANLGMSVSNLVRNILQHTVGLVEDIVGDGARIARIARGEREDPPPPASRDVLGWQEAVLNVNAVCEECNALLPRGARAGIAVVANPQRRPALCLDCLRRLERSAAPPSGPSEGGDSGAPGAAGST